MTSAPMILMILVSSFLGSYHCALMCGPIVCNFHQGKSIYLYHAGRIISYCTMGFLVGYYSSILWKSEISIIPQITGTIIGATLIAIGINYFKRDNLKFNFMKLPILRKFFLTSMKHSFLIGFLSVFLPCSWLYTFLLAAAQTNSGYAGALVMLLFCVGSIPALTVLPVYFKESLKSATPKRRMLTGALICLAGIYSIGMHLFLSHH